MSTCEHKCPGSVLKKMMVGLIMVDDGGVSDANDGVSHGGHAMRGGLLLRSLL